MKNSKQRDLILSIVEETHTHPTADWIYGEAKKKMPKIGLATVYRNLNLLVQLEEINKITVPGEVDRYDALKGEHYHMKCSNCGKIIDLIPKSSEAMEHLKETIRETFSLYEGEFNLNQTLLTGICNNCKDTDYKS